MEINKEPIALVGIGCRFPGGASGPNAYWNRIRRKKDAIVDVPKDRWDIRRFYDENPDKPGKMYVKQGGFLKEKIDRFDPLFFGISPREAESMDPQQRLLLEVTWEAFEDGGLIESELRGSRTGVFVGGFCLDSMLMRFGQLNRELASSHSAASSTMTMLSNRISYTFDLKGPSLTMDTACSSSLVATHYACQSIWSGESKIAIVGGVNVMLRPEFPIVMSKGKFLSPHGRCKAFDEDAAGYARGEGAGVVILKPLSAALENRDRIYGLVRETGVNQDGRTAGITLPDSVSQETLIREVYQKAGIEPSDIDYVEAHGTGTQAGDPAEIRALDRVLRKGRKKGSECHVGSVKTNIGHLEAGAGVAGLIKAVLSLHHEAILPNLHFKNPSSKIPWDDICIRIPTNILDWKRCERVRYAGVNSFGYGGTNAHVLLQEAPAPVGTSTKAVPARTRPLLVPISARNEEALREIAAKYAFSLAMGTDDQSVANFCYTAACRRSHHSHRAAVLAEDVESLRNRLQQFSTGETVDQLSIDTSDATRASKLVFVYTGMGPQWWAMGRELMKTEPVFLKAIQNCDVLFREQAGWSILEELEADESNSRMAKTEVAQPANFVIQVGLTELWRSWGIKPYAVIGHSVGEVASAYVSGSLSLKDAITVSLHRSKWQQSLAGQGSMIAAGLSEQSAIERIGSFPGVSIAAINSPNSVTLSGDSEQIEGLACTLEEQGLFVRRLEVEVAYHSAQMDPIKDQLLDVLKEIEPRKATIPLFSTVVGDRITGEGMNAAYWWHNVRQPVRFLDGIRSLFAEGCFDFVEIGPHPVLGFSIKEIASEKEANVRLTPSLNRKFPESMRMLESLGQLYSQGQSVNWEVLCPSGGELIQLPTYPWQKEKYWIETEESLRDRIGQGRHALLNRRLKTPQPVWTVELNGQFFPYLKDHVVNGQTVFPGAGYIEAGLQIAQEVLGGESWVLSEVDFHRMLQLDESASQTLYLSYDGQSGAYYVHSLTFEEEEHWQLHASGKLSDGDSGSTRRSIDIDGLCLAFGDESPPKDMYAMLKRRGLQYGEQFQLANRLWLKEDEMLVQIDEEKQSAESGSIVRPEILDTAFHSLLSIVDGEQPYVPQRIGRISFSHSNESIRWIHGTITERGEAHFCANLQLIGDRGKVCLEIRGVYMRKLPGFQSGEDSGLSQLLYVPKWREYTLEGDVSYDDGKRVLFLADDPNLREMEKWMRARDGKCCTVRKGSEFRRSSSDQFQICENRDEDFERLLNEISDGNAIRILYFWSLDAAAKTLDFHEMVNGCLVLVRLIKAIKKLERIRYSITIVTKGSQSLGYEKNLDGLSASPMGGLGQLFENECENIDCQLIDLDPLSDLGELSQLIDYLWVAGGTLPKELAFREGKAYSMTLQRFVAASETVETLTEEASTESPLLLEHNQNVESDSFVYRRTQRASPGLEEIEIRTQSVCVNSIVEANLFGSSSRAAKKAPVFGKTIGTEVAGIVTQVGRGVDSFREGDRIIALNPNGIRTFHTINPDEVICIPDSFAGNDALGYVGMVAACYAFADIAKLEPGDRVLIDGAVDGVGLFAIQIAKWKGAEVFATAGDNVTGEYLKGMGVEHVLGSNADDIVDEVSSLTNGAGVNVMLSARGRGPLRQALSGLAPCGCFIEIRNATESRDRGFPTAVLEKNIQFASIDMGRLFADRPSIAKRLIQEVRDGFLEGRFTAIPAQRFPANRISEAFRYLESSDRIGNVVITFEKQVVKALPGKRETVSGRKTGSVVITGGNSGFGLEVAKWLAEKTDYRIVLVSRSGATSQEAIETIDALRRNGTRVVSESIDVTKREQLEALITRLNNEGPPICGIVHGAMVLEDAFVQDLDEQKLEAVMAPKIMGAINLYRSCKDMDIDFFVSFSSVSSLVGTRGQASYVAANAFLDSFSRRLRAIGFPAVSINWGALAESGVVARNETIGKLLEKEGVMGISNQQALAAIELILPMSLGQIGVFDLNWDKWREFNPRVEASTRFAPIIKDSRKSGQSDRAVVLVEALDRLESLDQLPYLTDLVIEGLGKVLKVSPSKIDSENTLDNLGIDSLMLIELSLTIQSEFGLSIPAAELPKYPTVKSLASNIEERLGRVRQAFAA